MNAPSRVPPSPLFVEPPWHTGLDPEKVIAAIPPSATIAGMFYLAVVEGARRRNVPLSLPQERYLPFNFYSVKDFARVLVQAAPRFHPDLSLRQALRMMGQRGPKAFAASTLGKVTLGAAQDVHATVIAIAKTYEINTRPSRCEVLHCNPTSIVLALESIHYFMDSHHVGVFEGTLQHAGVAGSVRIAARSATSAHLLLEWSSSAK